MSSIAGNLAKLLPPEAAKYLLGKALVRQYRGIEFSGRIVETEAYHQDDPASHSFRGLTPRTAAMFGPAGHAYIYFTYGAHWCFNVTCGPEGEGSGILIRALEPLNGLEVMIKNRFPQVASELIKQEPLQEKILKQLCNGPGKLTQALSIDKSLYGHDLSQPPLWIKPAPAVSPTQIVTTTRIGIKQAIDRPWRFYIKNNPHVSRLT